MTCHSRLLCPDDLYVFQEKMATKLSVERVFYFRRTKRPALEREESWNLRRARETLDTVNRSVNAKFKLGGVSVGLHVLV